MKTSVYNYRSFSNHSLCPVVQEGLKISRKTLKIVRLQFQQKEKKTFSLICAVHVKYPSERHLGWAHTIIKLLQMLLVPSARLWSSEHLRPKQNDGRKFSMSTINACFKGLLCCRPMNMYVKSTGIMQH